MSAENHEVTEFDVSDLEPHERALVEMLLDGSSIPNDIDGAVLLAPESRADDVRSILDGVLAERDAPLVPGFQPGGPNAPRRQPTRLAPVTRRVAAVWLTQFVWFPMVIALVALGMTETAWVFWFVPLLVDVTLTATTGYTPGKFLLGMRTIDADGRPPGWSRAIVRSAMLDGPAALTTLAVFRSPAAGWAVAAWTVLLLVTTATNQRSQGLHDRVAGTFVVLAPRGSKIVRRPGGVPEPGTD